MRGRPQRSPTTNDLNHSCFVIGQSNNCSPFVILAEGAVSTLSPASPAGYCSNTTRGRMRNPSHARKGVGLFGVPSSISVPAASRLRDTHTHTQYAQLESLRAAPSGWPEWPSRRTVHAPV